VTSGERKFLGWGLKADTEIFMEDSRRFAPNKIMVAKCEIWGGYSKEI
jgi:hypothetical protein